MLKFQVITQRGPFEISATCEEMAWLEIEDQGLGPILSVKQRIEGSHE